MIDVRDLRFHYQGSKHQVFDHFALQLQPGCVYGLLGKNGTGKSTLLYLIAGLLRPNSGTVTVDGKESWLRLPEMLQEMFIVPEEYAMPDMSFEAFADMMRAFYPHFSDELLGKCLADFEMPAEPNLKELSMGQKKKVYMSFAISTLPQGGGQLHGGRPYAHHFHPSGPRHRESARPCGHHQPKPRAAQRLHRRSLTPLFVPLHLTAGNGRHGALCRTEPAR